MTFEIAAATRAAVVPKYAVLDGWIGRPVGSIEERIYSLIRSNKGWIDFWDKESKRKTEKANKSSPKKQPKKAAKKATKKATASKK